MKRSRTVWRWLPLLALAGIVGPVGAYTGVSGNLSGAHQWTLSGSPYRLIGDATLVPGATLTVDPGVLVQAVGNFTLTIAGRLQISASVENPVTFTSRGLPAGGWGGLRFAPTSTSVVVGGVFSLATDNVTVDGARVTFTDCKFLSATRDGAVAYNSAQFIAQGCTFADSGRRGLYLETVYPTGSITNCTFKRSGEYPVFLKANCVGMLGVGLQFLGNARQQIAVSTSAAADLQRDQAWKPQPVPLNLTAGSSDRLTIPAGLTLTLRRPLTLICGRLDVDGRLVSGAVGSGKVLLTGPASAPGSWEGLCLNPGAQADLISTRLRYAATGITCTSARLIMTNCKVSYSQNDGVNVSGSSQVTLTGTSVVRSGRYGLRLVNSLAGSVSGCAVSGNGHYPVFVTADNVPLLGTRNGYRNNAKQAIGVACDAEPDVFVSATWKNQGIPYDLTAWASGTVLSIATGATLTLKPGTTVYGGGVDVHGNLQAVGAPGHPIQFLPAPGWPGGHWQGINFYPGSSGRLSNCVVESAATGVLAQSASPRLEQSVLRRCQTAALVCAGTARPVVTFCAVVDNQGEGISVRDTARPVLGDLTNASTDDDGKNAFAGNAGYDLANRSSANLMAQNNWWGTTNQSEIQARILDRADSPGYGLVTFLPVVSPSGFPVPVLTWTGQNGYVSDGVRPDSGPPGVFEFRVKYTSAAGRPPAYVRLALRRGEYPYLSSPYPMRRQPGGDFHTGVIYKVSVSLRAGRNYAYRFEAADSLQPAVGAPAEWQPGPVVNTPPALSWTGEPGYETGGVSPTSGPAGSSFAFRVKYTDADGDLPPAVLLHVQRSGVAIPGSPFGMGWQSGEAATGATYALVLTLPAGDYRYRFGADDGLREASGDPTAWQTGPQVSGGPSALLASLSAMQAPAGNVEIRCRVMTPARLSLGVRNLAGRTVATIASDLPCGVGERVILWNCRSSRGTRLPPGNYLLEVTARTDTGLATRRLLLLSLR